MFVETDWETAQTMLDYMNENGIIYTLHAIKDLVHMDISNITLEQKEHIRQLEEESRPKERRVRTHDQRFHTLGEEAAAWFNGDNEKEEIERE